jgi:hypothetical protein
MVTNCLMVCFSLMSASTPSEGLLTNYAAHSLTNRAGIFVNAQEDLIEKIEVKVVDDDQLVGDYTEYPVSESLIKGVSGNVSQLEEVPGWHLRFHGLKTTYTHRPVNSLGMTVKEIYQVASTNRIRFAAGYFRGHLFKSDALSLPEATAAMADRDWATIFSSEDRKKLVVALDQGGVYFSENSGVTWQTINRPGLYTFALSSTPKGSAVAAVVRIVQNTKTNDTKGWYLTGSSAAGTKIVVSSESVPVLEIVKSNSHITVSWDGTFYNYALQQNDSLASVGWLDVTNEVNTIADRNQVVLPADDGNQFFRLRLK